MALCCLETCTMPEEAPSTESQGSSCSVIERWCDKCPSCMDGLRNKNKCRI